MIFLPRKWTERMLRGIHRKTAQCASEPYRKEGRTHTTIYWAFKILFFQPPTLKKIICTEQMNGKNVSQHTHHLNQIEKVLLKGLNTGCSPPIWKNAIFATQMNGKNVARHAPEDCAPDPYRKGEILCVSIISNKCSRWHNSHAVYNELPQKEYIHSKIDQVSL
jgi:hypothetical protein